MRVLFLRRVEGVPEGRQAPAVEVEVVAAAAVDMVAVVVAVAAATVVVAAADIWVEVARAQD